VKWVAGSENDSDMFTKNLDGPLFERFASVYVGKDEYTPVAGAGRVSGVDAQRSRVHD